MRRPTLGSERAKGCGGLERQMARGILLLLLPLLLLPQSGGAQLFPLGPTWRLQVTPGPAFSFALLPPAGPPAFTCAAAFLTALQLNVSLYQANGNARLSLAPERPLAAWGAPTLASAAPLNASAVLLQGLLQPASGAAAAAIPWRLLLAASPASPAALSLALSAELPVAAAGAPALALRLALPSADDALLGLGVQYSYLDLRGRAAAVYSTEQGVGRGLQPLTAQMDALDPGAGGRADTTYSQVPALYSAAGWALALEGPPPYCEVDARAPAALALLHLAPQLAASLLWGGGGGGGGGGGLLGAAAAYGLHVGAGRGALALPAWVDEGAIIGLEGGTEAVLAALSALAPHAGAAGIAGVWLQDWCGAVNYSTGLAREGVWWNWQLNASHYPRWHSELLPAIASVGARALAYVNPMLTPDGPLFAEAAGLGHLVPRWRDYGGKGLLDLASAPAAAWYAGTLARELAAANVSGWMADFGEGLPCLPGAPLAACTAAHGQYPLQWAAVNARVAAAVGGGGALFFQRAVAPASPALTPLFWLGDQLVTWDAADGLKSAVVGLVAASLAGAGVTHSDTGGYTSLALGGRVYGRSRELLARWAEFSAFTFAMRTHPGSNPGLNWQVHSDAATAAHFFACVRVFQALAGLRRGLRADLAAHGTPPYAPMAAHFPAVPEVLPAHQQFMMGGVLLVAPVTDAGAASARVWLPAGTQWRHFGTNETFAGRGEEVEVAAPIGQPCALWLV